jgi:hypothetical protein
MKIFILFILNFSLFASHPQEDLEWFIHQFDLKNEIFTLSSPSEFILKEEDGVSFLIGESDQGVHFTVGIFSLSKKEVSSVIREVFSSDRVYFEKNIMTEKAHYILAVDAKKRDWESGKKAALRFFESFAISN